MAKITRSNSKSALADSQPHFHAGGDRFSIGVTSRESGVTFRLHLTEVEAQRFADFMTATRKVGA